MIQNEWITNNWSDILQWAKNACQQHQDWEDLAQYSVTVFLEHEKAQELVEKGHARWFLVRIMLNSSRGKGSEFYRLYRPESYTLTESHTEAPDTEYDYDIDKLTEWINGVLEDMQHDDVEMWYRGKIFQLCMEQDKLNFSKLARQTGIPRTSISQAYYETIGYIREKIYEYADNNYGDLRHSLLSYLDSQHLLVQGDDLRP